MDTGDFILKLLAAFGGLAAICIPLLIAFRKAPSETDKLEAETQAQILRNYQAVVQQLGEQAGVMATMRSQINAQAEKFNTQDEELTRAKKLAAVQSEHLIQKEIAHEEALAQRDQRHTQALADIQSANALAIAQAVDAAVAKAVKPLHDRIETLEHEKREDDTRHTNELKAANDARSEAVEARKAAEENARQWKGTADMLEKRLAELEKPHKGDTDKLDPAKVPDADPADAPAAPSDSTKES